jgi:hypothetical protein
MTDIDKIRQLFDGFGIGYTDKNDCITIQRGNEKVDGYVSSYAEFKFDADGKFIKAGIWE